MNELPALLLGFTIPDAVARPIFAADPLPAVQTHNFAWSLARALGEAHEHIYLLSAVPVQSYPLVPRKWFSASSFVENGVEGRTIAFANLVILKHLTRFLSCLAALPQIRRWRIRSVYIHGVHSPFLLFGALLALLGYRVVTVLTDPPGVILPTEGKLVALLKRADRAVIRVLVRRSTAIVALARELARPYQDRLPVLVVPGILNGSWVKRVRSFGMAPAEQVPPGGRPVVLYAGGLAAAYGVDRLIDAATLLPDVDFVFYGKGDQAARLENGIAPNIVYGGFADAAQLAEAMRKASILINSRPSNADFAVQSFPSKLIEYLATGRTVLTTRIHSIPPDLADHFEYIDDETPAGIASAIRRALAAPSRKDGILSRIEALYGEVAVGTRLAALAANGPDRRFGMMSGHARDVAVTRPRLILLTQWFDPEPTFKGLLFARSLRDRGYDVEVVTGFPNYPGGTVYDGYRIRPMQRDTMDGIAITRLALYPSHDNRTLARAANYLTFCLSVFIYLTFVARRADVLYAYHPPLTVGFAAALANLFRRTPTVLDVQDMWPDTLTATGMVNSSRPLRLIDATCRWVYARMTHIVVLSPGFKRLMVERGVPADKVTMIYNWADESAILTAGASRPAAMPDDGRFRLLFAGNMGLAQNLDVVLDAARIVAAANDNVEFCFLGDGLETARLRQRAVNEQLGNVFFFPKVSMANVGSYLSAADCLLVNLRPDALFDITIPSKTQAYMSAGRPIIIAVSGDAAALVESAGAGMAVPPGDAGALARAVLDMAALSPDARTTMAQAAQNYYNTHLSLRCGADAFDTLFRAIMR